MEDIAALVSGVVSRTITHPTQFHRNFSDKTFNKEAKVNLFRAQVDDL